MKPRKAENDRFNKMVADGVIDPTKPIQPNQTARHTPAPSTNETD